MMSVIGSVLDINPSLTSKSWTSAEVEGATHKLDSGAGVIETSLFIIVESVYSIMALGVMLLKSTVLLPFLLDDLGFPVLFKNMITGVVWMVYAVGIVQFVANRTIRGG